MEINRKRSHAEIAELYEKADAIQPLAEKDGQVYCSFEDASVLNSLYAYENDGHSTGMQLRNADGSLASTGKRVHAINPDYFFANRVLKKGKKLYVVSGHEPTGYRCIKEQSSGQIFVKVVPVYIIARNADGELYVESLSNTDDRTFISEYTNRLDNALMAQILPLITAYGKDQTPIETMPI